MTSNSDRRHEAPPTRWSRFFAHINHNSSGILYGTVLAAAATAIVSAKPAKTGYVEVSIVLMLAVYSLAHLYAQILAALMHHPDAPLWGRLKTEAIHEAAVLEGGLPVLFCFAVLRISGVGVAASAQGASWFTVALLAGIGYRIARSLHATGFRLTLEVTGAAAIGLVVILLKTLLH